MNKIYFIHPGNRLHLMITKDIPINEMLKYHQLDIDMIKMESTWTIDEKNEIFIIPNKNEGIGEELIIIFIRVIIYYLKNNGDEMGVMYPYNNYEFRNEKGEAL